MRYAFFAFSLAALISACGGGGGGGGPTVPIGPGAGGGGSPIPTATPSPKSSPSATPTTTPTLSPTPTPTPTSHPTATPTITPSPTPTPPAIITKGAFSEYVLPSRFAFYNVVNGASDTVWFTNCNDGSIERMSAANATVTTFAAPPPDTPATCTLSNIGGTFWYALHDRNEGVADVARATGAGTFTLFDATTSSNTGSNAVGISGAAWIGLAQTQFFGFTQNPGIIDAIGVNGQTAEIVRLPEFGLCGSQKFYFVARVMTVGPDGNIYVDAVGREFPCRIGGSAVFKISPNGAILARYDVAPGSAMVTGPDGNIWFTDASGRQIVVMTTGGATTSYAVPHPSAIGIAAGTDGALWFTETDANMLGSISTSGQVTEYPIPFSGSPGSIVACPAPATTNECGPRGGVWFVYTNQSNTESIVRFNKP